MTKGNIFAGFCGERLMSAIPRLCHAVALPIGNWLVRRTSRSDVHDLVALSRQVYPWDPYTKDQLLSQIEVFPSGQFVACDQQGRIVGMSASMILSSSACSKPHSWASVTTAGTIAEHSPGTGDVLYGVETLVHPSVRRVGVAQQLMRARFMLGEQLGLSKHMAAVRLVGYISVADRMSPEEYYSGIVNGSFTEGCLTMLFGMGYRQSGIFMDYLPGDPYSLGHAVRVERSV